MFICKNCGVNKVDIDGIMCNECRDSDYKARSFLYGITHGRARLDNCDHENKGMWNYRTVPITDLYGNEGSIDIFTCAACGEVMEEERTS